MLHLTSIRDKPYHTAYLTSPGHKPPCSQPNPYNPTQRNQIPPKTTKCKFSSPSPKATLHKYFSPLISIYQRQELTNSRLSPKRHNRKKNRLVFVAVAAIIHAICWRRSPTFVAADFFAARMTIPRCCVRIMEV